MTYRSEQTAFAAEARELAAELEAAEHETERLQRDVERRAAVRRARLANVLLSIALVAAVIFAATRFFARREAAARHAASVQEAESEIAALQAEQERFERGRRLERAFKPLLGVVQRMDTSENAALFADIRDADPTDVKDAWWIVAVGACGVPYVAATRAEALEQLPPDRRARARKLCP